MGDKIQDLRSPIQQFSRSELSQSLRVFKESIVKPRHSMDLSVSAFATSLPSFNRE
jgi:hypothetical protein